MKYTCPCCGYFMFDERPGSDDICEICFWEDDLSQLRFPRTTGANHVSLIEGQKSFVAIGACEKRVLQFVRKVSSNDVRDESWRPVDPARDNIEEPICGVDYGKTYPRDSTDLYYWKLVRRITQSKEGEQKGPTRGRTLRLEDSP